MSLPQHPPMLLDSLFCEEQDLEDNNNVDTMETKADLFWEEDELLSLISKQKQTSLCSSELISDGSLMLARKEALVWILSVKSYFGFSCLTAVLAVNYFDRFSSSLLFQKDRKPWMTQLTAVACLSLAAKVEETHVPLLLDLQVEESKFVFEAKTIQRMEILVLSTLGYRSLIIWSGGLVLRLICIRSFYGDVSAFFYVSFQVRASHSFLKDPKFLVFVPSVVAAAIMLYVICEIQIFNPVDYQNQVLSVLKVSQGTVSECYKLILVVSGSIVQNQGHKRKHSSIPSSPCGVVDISFSSDTSNDSWAVASSVSSLPDTGFKRSRHQDQQMRLPSLNRVSVDVLSSRR